MPLTLTERIDILDKLGESLRAGSDRLDAVIAKSYIHNPWFTEANSRHALAGIAEQYLLASKLESWLSNYSVQDVPDPLRIAMVMAGNIPLVGFHDLLCTFASGYVSKIKLSEKDKFFIPFIIDEIGALDARAKAYFEVVDRLSNFDAVIATGSDNAARYFEQYFGKYPHIIRCNRHGVAVLNGSETREALRALADDIFLYFGLGCRNVSKIYVPEGYDFTAFLEETHCYNELVLHNKYKNNFDYNYTLYILNRIPHLSNGCLLLTEDPSLSSRIASLHYEYYKNASGLMDKLRHVQEQIQCIVAEEPIVDFAVLPFGTAQQPMLTDYADGVDTMQFLTQLVND